MKLEVSANEISLIQMTLNIFAHEFSDMEGEMEQKVKEAGNLSTRLSEAYPELTVDGPGFR